MAQDSILVVYEIMEALALLLCEVGLIVLVICGLKRLLRRLKVPLQEDLPEISLEQPIGLLCRRINSKQVLTIHEDNYHEQVIAIYMPHCDHSFSAESLSLHRPRPRRQSSAKLLTLPNPPFKP